MALSARVIATGVGHCEGPLIRSNGEIVVTSMEHGKLYRVKDGSPPEVFCDLGHEVNGSTEGADGTIYVTQAGGAPGKHGVGGIQAAAPDGSTWRWITRDPIAPNDLCFGPDGFLYFTDPTRRRRARDDGRLWRVNVETGEAVLLQSVGWYPNGIGFGLEDDAIYVANAIEFPGELHSEIVRFPLSNGKLGKPEVFIQIPETHRPDGFLFDVEGNITIGCNANDLKDRGQIQTYDRNGKLIDTFFPGPNPHYTNVALAADKKLIITDTTGGNVLAVDNWPHSGLPLHPFRKR